MEDREGTVKQQQIENLEQDVNSRVKNMQLKIDNLQNMTLDYKNSNRNELTTIQTQIEDKIELLERKIKAIES